MQLRAKAISLLSLSCLLLCAGTDHKDALAQGIEVATFSAQLSGRPTGKKANRCNARIGTIFLSGPIQRNTNAALAQLISVLYSEGVEEVWIVINSGGGDTGAAFAFYEFAKTAPLQINTYAAAQVHSSAVILFMAGERRVVDNGASILVHQNGLNFGKGTRINNSTAKGILQWNMTSDNRVLEILSESTGEASEVFSEFLEGKDNYIHPVTARELNIATEVGPYPVEFGGWLMEIDGATGALASYKTVFNPGKCPPLGAPE